MFLDTCLEPAWYICGVRALTQPMLAVRYSWLLPVSLQPFLTWTLALPRPLLLLLLWHADRESGHEELEDAEDETKVSTKFLIPTA